MEQWKIRRWKTKLFDVFHDENAKNAEMFVKHLEKCKLFLGLLGQNIGNLKDYGCPSVQDLIVAEEGRKFLWICSKYPIRRQSRPHCAEGIQRRMENRLCTIYISELCTCLPGLRVRLFQFFSTWYEFFIAIISKLWTFETRRLISQIILT